MSSSRTTMHYVNYYVISGHVFLLPQNSWKKRLVHPSSIIIICSLLCAMLVYYIMCSFLKLEYLLSLLLLLLLYYPFDLTCQMHTDYTVSAHDILIFEPFSVVFVKCTDINKQLDVFIV